MACTQSGVISTVKYPLDHGVDLMKVDVKGHTVLHNVVCAGTMLIKVFGHTCVVVCQFVFISMYTIGDFVRWCKS